MSLSALVFTAPLLAPTILSEYDHKQFGGFTKRFVQVDSRGEIFFVDTTTGAAVWEPPSCILRILLANKLQKDAIMPVRWFSIWNTPLIILLSHDRRVYTLNKINNRMAEQIPNDIFDSIEDKVKQEILEFTSSINQESQAGHKDISDHKTSELNIPKTLQADGMDIEQVFQSALSAKSLRTMIEDVCIEEKEEFWSFLREHSLPLLGDYSNVIQPLRQKSKDVRLQRLSVEVQEILIGEYLDAEKRKVQDKSKSLREVAAHLQRRYSCRSVRWSKLGTDNTSRTQSLKATSFSSKKSSSQIRYSRKRISTSKSRRSSKKSAVTKPPE